MKLLKKSVFTFLVLVLDFSVFAQSFSGDLNHSENSPLYFGNPSDAVSDFEQASDKKVALNFLMEKSAFTLSYNSDTLEANWVAWHLCASDLGTETRSNRFHPDETLPPEFYEVSQNDYKYSFFGFDRGHLCPSADRTASASENLLTFLMTNMIPQSPDNNRFVWKDLESFERSLVLQGNELYIFAGPYGKGGKSENGYFEEIPAGSPDSGLKITVPAYSWKIILCIPEGNDDILRVKEDSEIIAVLVPNVQGIHKTGSWQQFVTSTDKIEELTGFDFFELLDDDIENQLEMRVYD